MPRMRLRMRSKELHGVERLLWARVWMARRCKLRFPTPAQAFPKKRATKSSIPFLPPRRSAAARAKAWLWRAPSWWRSTAACSLLRRKWGKEPHLSFACPWRRHLCARRRLFDETHSFCGRRSQHSGRIEAHAAADAQRVGDGFRAGRGGSVVLAGVRTVRRDRHRHAHARNGWCKSAGNRAGKVSQHAADYSLRLHRVASLAARGSGGTPILAETVRPGNAALELR